LPLGSAVRLPGLGPWLCVPAFRQVCPFAAAIVGRLSCRVSSGCADWPDRVFRRFDASLASRTFVYDAGRGLFGVALW